MEEFTTLNVDNSSPANERLQNSNNVSSNVPNLSAMLAALTNSSSNVNSIKNSSIPSPQSAFALLTRHAAAAAMNANSGDTSNDVASSSNASTSFMSSSLPFISAANNSSNNLHSHNQQLVNNLMLLPPSSSTATGSMSHLITPQSNDCAVSNRFQQTSSSPHQQETASDVAAAAAAAMPAFKQFSKIFANVGAAGLNTCSMLAKIQQHLGIEVSASTSGDTSLTNPNFSLIPHAAESNDSNFSSNFLQQQNALSNCGTAQRQLLAAEQSFQQHRFPQGNVRFDVLQNLEGISMVNGALPMSSNCSISSANEPLAVTSSHNNSNFAVNIPLRRIRRRRPKSPRLMKTSGSNNLKSAALSYKPSSFAFSFNEREGHTEQQVCTPDDPVIHSPTSLLCIPSSNAMTLGIVETKEDLITKQNMEMMHNSSDINEIFNDGSRRSRKACLVCGDNATGYNFNVITCESCKAFFRRNALRPKDFKCPYSDNCDINTVSRRFCQKCRLRKCFNVGMKKEWILNEEQLKRRKNSRLNGNEGNCAAGYPSSQTPSLTSCTTPKSHVSVCSSTSSESTHDVAQSNETTAAATTSKIEVVSADLSTANPNVFNSSRHRINRISSTTSATAVSALSANSRHSTELPVISPPLMTSPTVPNIGISPLMIGKNTASNPDSPTSSRHMNNILPQIEQNTDQYDPNIMHIIPNARNNIYSALTTGQINMSSSTICGISNNSSTLPFSVPSTIHETISNMSSLSNVDSVTNSATLPANHPFPTSVEALFHRGEPKIALSVEDYQRLIRWNTNTGGGNQQTQLPAFEPMDSTSAEQSNNAANLLNKFTDHENAFISANTLSLPPTTSISIQEQLAAVNFASNLCNTKQISVKNNAVLLQNYLQQQQKENNGISSHFTPTTGTPHFVIPTIPQSHNDNSAISQMSLSSIPSSGAQSNFSSLGVMNTMFDNNILGSSKGLAGIAAAAVTAQLGSAANLTFGSNMMNAVIAEKQQQQYKQMEVTIQDELDNTATGLDHTSTFCNMLQDVKYNYQLNSLEQRELDIVRSAFACMDEPLDNTTSKIIETVQKTEHNPADIMNIMDITMRRYVKMAKKLQTFAEVSQDGKLQLLKAAMIDLLAVRGMLRIDSAKKYFTSPVLGNAKVLTKTFEKLNNYSQQSHFFDCCTMLPESVRTNSTAISLICLIVLFGHYDSATDENDKIVAKRHADTYENLLKRYLESIHGEGAASILAIVPLILKQLSIVSGIASTAFIGRVKVGETEPLPTEFFKTSPTNDIQVSVIDESEENDIHTSSLIGESSNATSSSTPFLSDKTALTAAVKKEFSS